MSEFLTESIVSEKKANMVIALRESLSESILGCPVVWQDPLRLAVRGSLFADLTGQDDAA